MYHPGTIDCLDESLYLGKYLGPAIDVGLAMATKALQHNCKVVYRSKYQPVTFEEQSNSIVTYRENAEKHLGAKLKCAERKEIGINNILENVP